MKDIVIRFFLAFFSYFLGETLTVAAFPRGMDFGLPFWSVVRDMLHYEYYGWQRIAIVAVISALLVIADRATSKKIHPVLLAIFAAFAGGYYYYLPYAHGYLPGLDFSDNKSEFGLVINATVDVFVTICFLLVITFPMVLLAACKGIAALFRRRAA